MAEENIFGLSLKTWVSGAKIKSNSEVKGSEIGRVIYFGRNSKATKNSDKNILSILKSNLLPWQLDAFADNASETSFYSGKAGPVWICRPGNLRPSTSDHYGLIEKSDFARGRDMVGAIVSTLVQHNLKTLVLEFIDASEQEQMGAMLGLELAAYSYSENRPSQPKAKRKFPNLVLRKDRTQISNQQIREMADLGLSMNIARHLTNVPGGDLNPTTYADAVKKLFRDSKVKIEIWNADRLKKENMGLILGVGKASAAAPCLVHLKYRPSSKVARKPIAFVGKGITFDTGGLDIKPSSAMRLMKKDMGGSAAVVGLAHWVANSNLDQPCDFYLALAENAIGSEAFRPGDILTARNGLTIEIHNTDAEGRLVLGDALDVAVTQAEKPEVVINLATLTGAIKVGLGGEIAGLFCNDDQLSDQLLASGQRRGDLSWRMPLFQSYKSMLKSTFADFANANDGFAGAITAALFLQQFVRDVPWAHLDIYAWKDSAGGAFAEAGGSGQPIQALSDFLTNWSRNRNAEAN